MLIWLRSSLGDSYFSNNSPWSDSYSISNLWGCLTFCPRMMPKTEITGVFSRPVSSCSSATHPLPFQEFSAIFLPSDSCRAVNLWSPHSSSGGSPVWLMGTQQLLLHLCFLLLPDMSCILETFQLWLLWNILFRLLSYPHTRGFGLFLPWKEIGFLLLSQWTPETLWMRMVLSCLLKRTLHYTRVFWDTFSRKHNSMFVKIILVSSSGECGGSWGAYGSSWLMPHSRLLRTQWLKGMQTQDCRSPGMPCGGSLGNKARRK